MKNYLSINNIVMNLMAIVYCLLTIYKKEVKTSQILNEINI